MNINDYQLGKLIHKTNILKINPNSNINKGNKEKEIHTLILDLAKLYSIDTKIKWNQIEYLSLRNSLIKHIDFIKNMPNIFYLDLLHNPIDVFTPLLFENTYGYLCFSPPSNYFEQRILSIEKLNVIFLNADIKDISIKKNFLQKNPNIMVLNNDIIDFEFKIKLYSCQRESKKFDEDESNNLNFEKNILKSDVYYENKFKVKNKEECTNDKILEIEKFFKDYNNKMLYFQKNGKLNYKEEKVNLEEKKKLIAISDCYLNILYLNNPKNKSYFKYIPIKEKIDKNIIENSSIKYNKINLNIFKHFSIPSLREFLLSVLVLYIFKILSKDITFELLKLILLKSSYYIEDDKRKKNLENDILNIINLDSNLFICMYYKIYDLIFGIYSNKRLNDIQMKLQMNEITSKIMNVTNHQNNFINMLKSNSDPFKKSNIIKNELILYLNQNNIFNNLLMIIQYVDDYIIYNSIQKKLALKNSKDLQFFNDIKNHMYFSLDKKKDNDIQSIAEKNYNKIQMKSLFNNKYFFDTENYMKTKKYFTNVFLNYKHGMFYPNKNKIKKIKNDDIEEELKNIEKEKLKDLYVKNNLNSFFNIKKLKAKNIIKEKNKNNYKNKICGNDLNIKTISIFNNENYFKKSKRAKRNNNIRKIDSIDFELIKKSQDKLFKTSYNLNSLLYQKPKDLSGIDPYILSNKKNLDNKASINTTNINNNLELLTTPIHTLGNINTNHKYYETAVNYFTKSNNNKNNLMKFNSMNEVLNNVDLSDKGYFINFKNKNHIENNLLGKNSYQKNLSLPKFVKLKNIKLGNKYNFKENLTKIKKQYYYNKSLGCIINFKKIMLPEKLNYSGDNSFKEEFKFNYATHDISPIRKIKNIKTNNNNSEYKNKNNLYKL